MAADDSQLVLQIVFDDGSVKQGFARMANDAKTTSKKVSDETAKAKFFDWEAFKAEGASAIDGIVGNFSRLGTAIGLVGGLLYSAKKLFDFTVEGEKINSIGTQFENLARSQGVGSNALRDGLAEAAKGLYDMEEVLQASTTGLVALGQGAARLPELFLVAKQAAAGFGGDAISRFKELEQAVASGQTRMLKTIGLTVDMDGALKDYAKTRNRTVESLTAEEAATIRLSAVLDKAKSAYAGIDPDINKTQNSTKKLAVAVDDVNDSLSILADSVLGGPLQSALSGTANSISRFSSVLNSLFGTGTSKLEADIKFASEELTFFQNKLNKAFGPNSIRESAADVDYWTERVRLLKAQLDGIKNDTIDPRQAVQSLEINSDPKEILARFEANQKAMADAETEKRNKILTARKQFRDQLLGIENDAYATELRNNLANATVEEQMRLQKESAERTHKQRLAQIEADAALGNFSASQINQLREAEARRHAANMIDIKQDAAKKQLDIEKKNNSALLTAASSVANGVANLTSQGIASIGAALVEGAGAFDTFKNNALGIIGDFLIQLGQAIIFTGAAIESLRASIIGMFGGQAIAAGIAMIALGGVLKSLGGKSTSSYSSAGGATSNLSGGGTTQTEVISPDEIERKNPDTYINLNINGDVLDSDETGMRIIDLVNSAFDKSGVKIQRGAVA